MPAVKVSVENTVIQVPAPFANYFLLMLVLFGTGSTLEIFSPLSASFTYKRK